MGFYRKTGQISAMANAQLAAWEKVAGVWILIPKLRSKYDFEPEDIEDYELHLVCGNCDMSVYAVSEQTVTPDVLKAAVVAHLRNVHRELEDRVYSE
jgi:hypothetical protein